MNQVAHRAQTEVNVIKCQDESGEEAVAAGHGDAKFRGPAGWLCDGCWSRVCRSVDKIKSNRRRMPNDTDQVS